MACTSRHLQTSPPPPYMNIWGAGDPFIFIHGLPGSPTGRSRGVAARVMHDRAADIPRGQAGDVNLDEFSR